MKKFLLLFALLLTVTSSALTSSSLAAPPNIVLIVSDDHRHDFLGFAPGAPTWLETPNLDKMAKGGVWLKNAFVSTSLCSPSRASVLTGQYAHHHGVVDNQRPVSPKLRFFPQDLQAAGYQTSFFGKWHMGHSDDKPQRGFDHWESFKGQGVYFDPEMNVNGVQQKFEGYTTDVLSDRALRWLATRKKDQPFFLYLSYKAVHYPFTPAPRNAQRYAQKKVTYPPTMANVERNYRSQPHWVRARRFGIHGVDHMEGTNFDNDPVPNFDEFYRDYCETVFGLDENIGRVLEGLEKAKLLDGNTLVLYLGDNGFHLGEHGFYDKRDAFETSIRIPMLAYAPKLLAPGKVVEQMVQNIDVAPTLLDIAGVPLDNPQRKASGQKIDGRSFKPLLFGGKLTTEWRKHILYEYYWEWNFPACPTQFALRTDRYKYVFYHGTWDHNSLYDLQTDPTENHNLISVPHYQPMVKEMRKQLFDLLEKSGSTEIPILRPQGDAQYYDRKLPD